MKHRRQLQFLLKFQIVQSTSFPEFVNYVQNHSDVFSPSSLEDLKWILGHRGLWVILNQAVRKNSCLYLSMMLYSYEIHNGRTADVNVTYSMDTQNLGTGGHCWITRDDELLIPMPGDEADFGERIAQQGDVHYWVRMAIRLPNPRR